MTTVLTTGEKALWSPSPQVCNFSITVAEIKLYDIKYWDITVVSFCGKCELILFTVTTGLSTTGEKALW